MTESDLVPVNAENQPEISITENAETNIWNIMDYLDVAIEKRASLAEKVNNEELLDCDNPLFSNCQPVQKGWISDRLYIEKYVYPDGSVKVTEINLRDSTSISGVHIVPIQTGIHRLVH